jgi:putative Holliday junction resolvase
MNRFKSSKKAQLYWHKRILALDFGEKFTGLALYCPSSDPYPVPYDRIAFKSDQQLANDIKLVIDSECIDIVVIGIPRLTDGTETNMTKRVRLFKATLVKNVSCEVFEQDETLSTFEAKDRMKNSPQYNFEVDLKKIDALSASIILEEFIIED